MANYLDNLRDIVNEAHNRIRSRTIPVKRNPGRPETNPVDIAKTLLLQTYSESPNRVAEGLLLLFREKLDISEGRKLMAHELTHVVQQCNVTPQPGVDIAQSDNRIGYEDNFAKSVSQGKELILSAPLHVQRFPEL